VDPAAVIPHRPPFLLLDDVSEVEPGRRARGRWHLRAEEPFFAGHFPGLPTLPGVLMVESLAQLGAVAVRSEPSYSSALLLFGGIDRARFRRRVVPGETLELEMEVLNLSRRAGKGHGRATVDGAVACEADLLFVVAPE